MNLQQQSEQLLQELLTQFSPDLVHDIDIGFTEIITSVLDQNALQEGDRAPDFALPNPNGQTVSLENKLKKGTVVLTFYRGGWCPFCNLQLRAYQQVLNEIKYLGASLIAISPETPDNSLNTKEKNELEFEVLSDRGNEVAQQYGLVFVTPKAHQQAHHELNIPLPAINGDDSWTIPIPATYVIDTDSTIIWTHTDPNYRLRAEPEAILNALQTLKKADVK